MYKRHVAGTRPLRWGLERNRNGGSAAAAVLSLRPSPANSVFAAADSR